MSRNRKGGFTLVELLTSMSLAAIAIAIALSAWFGFYANVIQKQRKSLAGFGTDAAWHAVEGALRHGQGLIELREDGFDFQDADGKIRTLWWDSDSLRFDGQSIIEDKVLGLQVRVLDSAAQQVFELSDAVYLECQMQTQLNGQRTMGLFLRSKAAPIP